MYSFKETDEFRKKFNKLPYFVRLKFKKQFKHLRQDPYSAGTPLGNRWFRELKNGIYRVYYLIYDEEIIILLVNISKKKDQQTIINFTKDNLSNFHEVINDG